MSNPDMLYIKCKSCGETMATGFSISRNSTAVLNNNQCGPCSKCGKNSNWSGHEAFYKDGTPFE